MYKTASDERRRIMKAVVQRLALEVDPIYGRLLVLADELGVRRETIFRWLQSGEVHYHRAAKLNKRFGNDLANIELLTNGKETVLRPKKYADR